MSGASVGLGGWVWALIVCVVLAAMIGGAVYNHKRSQALAAFAHSRGMTYTRRQDEWARRDLGWPSGVGRSHRAHHVISGRYGDRDAVVFEHSYVTGSGKERKTHRAMVCTLGLPAQFPALHVSKENFLTRTGRALGVRDVELESEAFNREFRVTGADRRLAYDVLHPRLMQWLLDHDAPGFTIISDRIVLARDGRLKESLIEDRLQYLSALVDQLPRRLLS